MSIISIFFGIVIRIYFQGKLLKKVLSMIEEWRSIHEKELLKAWNSAQQIKPVKRIKPLEE